MIDPPLEPALSATCRTSMQIDVEVVDVDKAFKGEAVLRGINLAVRRGEFFSLLGPSGCGKTTLLRILAGFETADRGEVRIQGQDVSGLPPERRSVNTVFQSYALFPHLSVFDNVAFGLRMRKVPPRQVTEEVERVLSTVEITGLRKRYPHELSGGQKQRVALARAIVNRPAILLLDEPLSALDLKLRRQLRFELKQLQGQLGMTFVFVTHDQDEALGMSDRTAIMYQGRIIQVGPVRQVYERPATPFVAQFLGTSNLLVGTVAGTGWVNSPLGEFSVPGVRVRAQEVHLSVRPEKVRLARSGFGSLPNQVPVWIEDVIYMGAQNDYLLMTRAGLPLRASVLNSGECFTAGERLVAHLPPEHLVVLQS